jgi:hypothetical protein
MNDKTIRVSFIGRTIGALGLLSQLTWLEAGIPADATDEEVRDWVRVRVYETHEHIADLRWCIYQGP